MKKTMAIVGFVIVLLGGCGGNQTNASNSRFDLISEDNVDGYGVYTIKDSKTGCEYILTTGSGTATTPLLNSDGKPICE